MVKSFSEEFNKLLHLVSSNQPFCFTRFSDGEVTILRNKTVVLGNGYFIQGDLHGDQKNIVHPNCYNEEERKELISLRKYNDFQSLGRFVNESIIPCNEKSLPHFFNKKSKNE